MADWNVAYNWMMDSEDAPRACQAVPDACPNGFAGPCYAICGINSAVFPKEYAEIAAQQQDDREPLVQQFYQNHFWNQWYEQLESDDVAKRVFDFAVNGGSGASVRCLQIAINSLASPGTAPITEDGGWGPQTLAAANAKDSTVLTAAFTGRRIAYYEGIAATNPAKACYLNAWVARAQR
jgi:hypothetical protein